MDEISPDGKKVARVKELEQIVKKLEEENKQLLNKVRTESPTLEHRQLAGAELEKLKSEINGENGDDDAEGGVINLDDLDINSKPEGEWLFVSPKLQLTPAQRRQSPQQWLSEGHDRRRNDENIPSLNEVRKSLVFNMDEAETLTRTAYPRPSPSNRTARHYLDKVRERLGSNSPPLTQQEDTRNSIHIGNWTSQTRHSETQNSQSVPVVRWKARMPQANIPPSSDQSENIPVVKWKAKQVPSVVPKIAWDPETDEDLQSGEEGVNNDMEETVPVVKWKAKMPQEENEDVPVVKWKAKMPQEENEDVPVVKWKAKMPTDYNSPEDDNNVPVVNRKVRIPSGSPSGSRAMHSPRRGGLLRPSGVRRNEPKPIRDYEESPIASGDSELSGGSDLEQRSGTNASVPQPRGLRQPHTSVSPSQSPTSQRGGSLGLKRPARTVSPGRRVGSQSPSGHTLSPHGTKQLTRPRATSSPSQPHSGLAVPNSSDSNSKMTGHQANNPSSNRKTGRHSSGLPHSPSTKGGQHVSRLQAQREGGQPSSSTRLRSPGGLKEPTSSVHRSHGSDRRGLTPPKGGGSSKPRRVLPTPPSSSPRPAPAIAQQQQEDDDSWLEGCF